MIVALRLSDGPLKLLLRCGMLRLLLSQLGHLQFELQFLVRQLVVRRLKRKARLSQGR